MTAQKGKDLLLKVDTDGAGDFTTVAGLRARSLAFNAATVDVTDQESAAQWRELLEGAGIKTARITGSDGSGDGAAGSGYGAGGGGAAGVGSGGATSAARPGGAGRSGLVLVEEFYG